MFRQITRLSLVFIVFACLTGLAVAQDNGDLSGPAQSGFRNGYADGFQQGREDLRAGEAYNFHGRDYDNAMRGYESYMGSRDEYREGYRRGYVTGYSDGYRGRESHFAEPSGPPPYRRHDDDDYGPGPGYGRRSVAFQTGFRDGMIAGGKDRDHNKQFRPTKNDKYEDADHGYSHDLGSKKEYKREYRDGFMAGYQRGFGRG